MAAAAAKFREKIMFIGACLHSTRVTCLLAVAAAWQSERLGALLFGTADTLPDLRRMDDALRCGGAVRW